MTSDNHCQHCPEEIRHGLEPFFKDNRISTTADPLSRMLVLETERHFPGVSRFIFEPTSQETDMGHLFAIDPRRVAADCISVNLVDAPLPFTAAVVSCHCQRCNQHHRIIHVGIPFYVTVSHIQAFLDGSHSQPARQLAQFLASLHEPLPPWQSHQPPPASTIHHALVASGMAWLLCHEVGHFAADWITPTVPLSASAAAKSRFLEELKADYASLRILVHRTIARGQQKNPGLSLLYLGIGLMLRAWHVCIPAHQRKADFLSYGPRLGAFVPSPTERWKLAQDQLQLHLDLGYISHADHAALERKVFSNDKVRINQLIEELDAFRNPD